MSKTRIISWNVNGIRAAAKKRFYEKYDQLDADILCLQETKAQDDQVQEVLESMNGIYSYSNSAVRKGYSGTAILSKSVPIAVEPDMGVAEHDQEGRILAAEFEKFFVVTVYVPNSGNGLKRIDYRQKWDKDFASYLKNLENTKPVIVVGDFNVAHQEIDLARPKPNYDKTAGYTQREIDGMNGLINCGFIDSYRHFNPETVKYSWWSFRGQAKANNVGWRLDYCLVSASLIPEVSNTFILNEVEGSDHCPVGLELG
jgi:exodeoxyribonuclease-3